MSKISVFGVLELDGAGWDKTLEHAEKGVENLKESSLRLGEALGLAFSAGTIIEAGKRTLEFAEQVKIGATRLNVTTDEMQRLGYAANQTGVEMGTVEQALDKLAKAKENAQGFGGAEPAEIAKLKEAFEQLGISFEDVKTKSPDEIFHLVGDSVESLGVNSRTTAAAMEIFGRSAGQLVPLFKELREKTAEAPLISEEDVESLTLFNQGLKSQEASITSWLAKLESHPLRALFGFTGFGKAEDTQEREEKEESQRRMAEGEETLKNRKELKEMLAGKEIGPNQLTAKQQDEQDKEIARLNADTAKSAGRAERRKPVDERIADEEKNIAELEQAIKGGGSRLQTADFKNQLAHAQDDLAKDRKEHLTGVFADLKQDETLKGQRGDSLTRTGNFLGSSSSSIVAIGERTNAILSAILTVLSGNGHGGAGHGTHGVPPTS